MLRETLVDMSAGVVLEMSPVVHEALRDKNLGSWTLDLPCPPEFQAEHNTASWHLELTRFFAHPEIVTVGITTDRGHEEMDYIPQLQSFRVTINGRAVGSLTLMTDHVVGSFHQMDASMTSCTKRKSLRAGRHEPSPSPRAFRVWRGGFGRTCHFGQTANNLRRRKEWMGDAWKSHLI